MRGWLKSHPQAMVKYDSPVNLQYGGGISGVGVTTGAERVYLVFWGSQWGTESTNGAGYQAFAGDAKGIAPVLQAFFLGLGTGGETWSGVMTQYCQGVTAGAQDCPASAAHVGYPTGGALAGIWEDNSATSPSVSTGHQLAVEAEVAATHFGNTTAASNRDAQYVIVSPTGTNPDNYENQGFCAWHDYSGDATLDGGGGASGPLIAFTNLPYIPDAGASCGAGFVNPGNSLDGVTIVEGHEYAETITDQFPAGGWTDSQGAETGDKCAWISSGQGASQDISLTTGSFAVQSTWANDFNMGAGDCEVSHSIVTDTVSVASTVDDATTNATWSSSETTGATAYDTASLIGATGPTPTGSVTYDLYGNGSCAGSPSSAAPETLTSGGSVPNSPSTSALAAGHYSYQASYSGDSNYPSTKGSCESFSVSRATPSVATTVDDATTNATWSGGETTGATAYDTASVHGVAAFTPSGSVTYDLYVNGSCGGSPASTTTKTLTSGGSVPNSATSPALAAGSYSYQAHYSGDSNYAAAMGPCEAFSVSETTPAVATAVDDATTNATWSGSEKAGATAYDTASVHGVAAFTPSGSVTYDLYVNGTCAGSPSSAATESLNAGGSVPNSPTTSALAVGSYSYRAHYSGDSNYAAKQGACETFTVGLAPNKITITSTAPAKPAVGGTYNPTATATAGTPVVVSLDASSKGCALAAGGVRFTAPGTCVIDFNNPGTASYVRAAQAQQTLNVSKGTLKLTASAAPTSVMSSKSVVLKVKLSSTLATGTVRFREGMTTLCTATLTSGKGSCRVTKALSAGSYKVTARYAGSTLFLAETATTSFKVT